MANSSKNTFNIRNVAFVAAWREIFGLNYFRQSWVRFILGAHAAQSVRETDHTQFMVFLKIRFN